MPRAELTEIAGRLELLSTEGYDRGGNDRVLP